MYPGKIFPHLNLRIQNIQKFITKAQQWSPNQRASSNAILTCHTILPEGGCAYVNDHLTETKQEVIWRNRVMRPVRAAASLAYPIETRQVYILSASSRKTLLSKTIHGCSLHRDRLQCYMGTVHCFPQGLSCHLYRRASQCNMYFEGNTDISKYNI